MAAKAPRHDTGAERPLAAYWRHARLGASGLSSIHQKPMQLKVYFGKSFITTSTRDCKAMGKGDEKRKGTASASRVLSEKAVPKARF